MSKDLKNFWTNDPEEIRKALGPFDDPDDPELYKLDFTGAAGVPENELMYRTQYNMGVNIKREIAQKQAKGIYNEKGHLAKNVTLPDDDNPEGNRE